MPPLAAHQALSVQRREAVTPTQDEGSRRFIYARALRRGDHLARELIEFTGSAVGNERSDKRVNAYIRCFIFASLS